MGNESGEWIMHGINWDNPDCIHSVDEAIKYINGFGFLPLFKNDMQVMVEASDIGLKKIIRSYTEAMEMVQP